MNASAVVYENRDLKHDDPGYRVRPHIPAQQIEKPECRAFLLRAHCYVLSLLFLNGGGKHHLMLYKCYEYVEMTSKLTVSELVVVGDEE
jgi:hypothetical protein